MVMMIVGIGIGVGSVSKMVFWQLRPPTAKQCSNYAIIHLGISRQNSQKEELLHANIFS